MDSKKFRDFEEARKFSRKLKLKNRTEWITFCKSGKMPKDIPTNPVSAYVSEWKGVGDWLGTGRIANQDRKYRQFNDARLFAQSLGLKGKAEWEQYRKSGKKPLDIPYHPPRSYKKEWEGWGDWLGTGNVASQDKQYRRFEDARKYIRTLEINNDAEWRIYSKSGKLPNDIPAAPWGVYKKQGWKDLGDWFGTGRIAAKLKQYRTFDEAKKYVQSLKLKNQNDWRKYAKSSKKPENIPADPVEVYKKEWKGYGDWLGTGRIAYQNIEWLPFPEAKKVYRELAKKYGLKNHNDWIKFSASGKRPQNIPSNPWKAYSKEKILESKKNEKRISSV